MKQIILAIVFLMVGVYAGATETINIGQLDYGYFTSQTSYLSSNDMSWVCEFTLTQTTDMMFDNNDSFTDNTYIHIYKKATATSDVLDLGEYYMYEMYFFNLTLTPGTYQVVSGLIDEMDEGDITLNFWTFRNTQGIDGFKNPIDLGCINGVANIYDQKNSLNYNNTYCLNSDQQAGQAGDIVYKFTVSNPIAGTFYLSNASADTWMALLDDKQALLTTASTAKINRTLNAGTYYLVCSTVNNKDGILNTVIQNTSVKPTITNPTFSTTQNYITTSSMTTAVSGTVSLSNQNSATSISYFDGLGRPIETIQKAVTPTGKDLVALTEYDPIGREYRHWLPVSSTGGGAFVDPATITANSTTLYNGDSKPYVETILEASPLNRTLGVRNQGDAFNTHPTAINYATNSATDVMCFFVDASGKLAKSGNYAVNSLYKTESTDEDNKKVTEFKDKQGRVVMKRSDTNTDTYFVYNDFNQLSYVLSPRASDELAGISNALSADNSNALGKLGYAYQYDERGNCIWKKLPGCEPILMVYDQADRMVLSQDGNQRTTNNWTYTKYDVLGRVIQTGTTTKALTTAYTLQNLRTEYATRLVTESWTSSGYSTTNTMGTASVLLTENYYDNYDFINLSANAGLADILKYKDKATDSGLVLYDLKYSYVQNNVDLSAKGLLTGTLVNTMDNATRLLSAMYYDDRGRVVQTRANNRLSGYDYDYFHYSFTGQVLNKRHVHKSSYLPSEITENYRFTYDFANRATGVYHQLNSQPEVTLSTMQYDELGRLAHKTLNGGGETIDFVYNIRNRITSITSPRFSETLYYQNALDGKPVYYNGNISAVKWGTGAVQDDKYFYTYDGLNRLKKATYSFADPSGAVVTKDDAFTEEVTQYDKNGNILGLIRNGYVHEWESEFPVYPSRIDGLTFEYNGNQMRNVWDDVNDQDVMNVTTNDFRNNYDDNITDYYLYDANGNQYADLNKGIAWIQYNVLNLPSKVQFSSGNKNEYLYSASGRKLKATYSYAANPMQIPLGQTTTENTGSNLVQSSFTEYCGNYVYEKSTGSQVVALKYILTPEGYISTYNGNTLSYISMWNYNYLLKDHLGNTRRILKGNYISSRNSTLNCSTSTIDYYPFGMEIQKMEVQNGDYAYPLQPSTATPYLYNGKEMDRMNGLNMLDYGARWRDAVVEGWPTVDPLCEKKPWISPYAFCAGNPVNLIDPDGMDWYKWTGENGKEAILWQEGNAKTLDLNGQTYNNVGENYSYTLGNTTYSFEQQKMVSMSVSVLDNNQFQTQFDSRFGDEKRQKVACKRACDVMESNAGVTSAGRNDATQQVGREVGSADNHSIVPTGNQANGDKTLVRDVEVNGNPVIVGVDRGKHGRGINDGTTDHWIVVSGYTYNLTNGTTSYNYFDPGNRNAAQGTNAVNVLTRTNNGLLINTNSRRTYTVTNIRPNR